MVDKDADYRLGFVSGGLYAAFAPIAAELYLTSGDWKQVSQQIVDGNLLQSRTVSTLKRYARELLGRLQELDEGELRLLLESDSPQRAQLMWVAACRRYQLLGDFAEQVVRERFLMRAPTLTREDFYVFVRQQAAWHPRLSDVKDRSLLKLQNNAYLMMREASLLGRDGTILGAVLTPQINDTLNRRTPSDRRFFPVSDAHFQGGKQ